MSNLKYWPDLKPKAKTPTKNILEIYFFLNLNTKYKKAKSPNSNGNLKKIVGEPLSWNCSIELMLPFSNE